jgi:ubiquinone/menaquinone biosynthesis C-methylase UbiE
MNEPQTAYVPALRFHFLTRYYDRVVSYTTREQTFKIALIDQVGTLYRKEVLDLGCGTGTLIQMLTERETEAIITGLDPDPKALEQAKSKAEKATSRVSLRQGFAQDMPFERATFDIVISSLFFHHLTPQQKLETFKEIHRVLKPGGQLHIADWGMPSSALQRGLFFLVQCLDGFETTKDSVEGALPGFIAEAGFVDIKSELSIPTPLGTIQLFEATAPMNTPTTNVEVK